MKLNSLPARPRSRRAARLGYPRRAHLPRTLALVSVIAIGWLGAACGGAALEYEPDNGEGVGGGGHDGSFDDGIGGLGGAGGTADTAQAAGGSGGS